MLRIAENTSQNNCLLFNRSSRSLSPAFFEFDGLSDIVYEFREGTSRKLTDIKQIGVIS